MKKISNKKKIVFAIILIVVSFLGILESSVYNKVDFKDLDYLKMVYYHDDEDYHNYATMDQKTIKNQETKDRIEELLKKQNYVRTWKKTSKLGEEEIDIWVKSDKKFFELKIYKASNDKSIIVIEDKGTYKCNDIWNDLFNILMENTEGDILECNVKW